MSNLEFPLDDHNDENLDALRSLEEQLFEMADDVPALRPSMRAEYLSELAVIEYRRNQLRCVPVVAALLLTFAASLFWTEIRVGAELFAMERADGDQAWMALRDSEGDSEDSQGKMAKSSDSLEQFDSYSEEHKRKIHTIRQRLGVVAHVTAHQ